ncbi:glycosyltransferase family 4 protein [Spongiivirga citrea]|uniref:Glycosyltransferase n=1 Tax=Spongiivirga citrea TaxID=1481457 RepID=A0A6M0CFP1_9FLAO|nr:glycosyltransferase family 4 protein [Spongiivirga citrea]NER16696.1 glycosyltransferase [Spongiivirga citrea]
MNKRVLILTYYWPPAGGPGVQRWLKFATYLQEFNIDTVVFIPENPTYPIIDESMLNEIPKGITVLKHPIFEPYGFAKVLSKKKTSQISSGIIQDKKQSFVERVLLFIRGNFFIPDARKYWVKPSVKFLNTYLKEENIDTVITTGPPHSVHLIGLQLKKKLNIKWLADFRDPWTTIGYHDQLKLTASSQRKHKKLESDVLNNADGLIVTSFQTKNEFEAITQRPISVITNGYEDMEVLDGALDAKFTISHIGSLLSARNPEILWQAIEELIIDDAEFANDVSIQIAGKVSESVIQSMEDYGLVNHIKMLGYVSHQEARKLQVKSQVLLLLEIDSEETKGIIAGKLFEYLSAKRPILAIGPKGADIQKIIEETKSGEFYAHQQKQEIKDAIKKLYKKYKMGTLESESIHIDKYHRRNLTAKLAELL